MAIHALLYVSRALVAGAAADAAVEAIVRVSRERNDALAVTGALLFSGGHFAQWLEGSRESVEELMASIARDQRHTDIAILEVGSAPARRFPDWTLAYAGRSTFVDSALAVALDGGPADAPFRVRRIRALLDGFAAV
jgi:hypothetical protein